MATADANRTRLRRVFEVHYEAVSRYCHRRLPADDANDAAARVFAVAWRKVDDMPSDDGVLPWLYAVARYEVSAVRRSGRRRLNLKEKIESQAAQHEPSPDVIVVGDTQHAELIAALESLRPTDQEILRLRAYEELTVSEIAVVLGCTVDTAKKRSTRAMNRLRRSLGVPSPGRSIGDPEVTLEGGEA